MTRFPGLLCSAWHREVRPCAALSGRPPQGRAALWCADVLSLLVPLVDECFRGLALRL